MFFFLLLVFLVCFLVVWFGGLCFLSWLFGSVWLGCLVCLRLGLWFVAGRDLLFCLALGLFPFFSGVFVFPFDSFLVGLCGVRSVGLLGAVVSM